MANLGARARSSLALLLGVAGCGDGPTVPRSGPPARIEVTSGANFSGSVGTVLETPLAVRVVDQQGRAVSGAFVRFSIIEGPGLLSPQSAVTGPTGAAQTRLTLGVVAGTYRVHATVSGVAALGFFIGEATPGAVARVVVTPGQARLVAVGDTMRLRARQYDAFGNGFPATTMTWTAIDPDVFTIDQTGLVTGTRALATGRAVASAGGRADTAFVVVANPDASPCLGYSAPVTLAIGQAIDVSMTDGACIASAAPDDEYVLIPWHGSTVGSSTVTLHVTGTGLTAVTAPQSLAPIGGEGSVSRTAREGVATDAARGFAFEYRIREMGRREVMPLARRVRGTFGAHATSASRAAAIPASLALGDFIELNANAKVSCSSPSLRTGRVAAVSSRAIVVHDTANPAGGFTDEDYQRFAITFDTLVAPVDEGAFGAPTDIDRNGRVVIFFTRAVNELTDAGASFYIGGFFHPRDLLPKQQSGTTFCAGSNEGEMFYLFVPDTGGVVNGNKRRVGFVDSVTIGTLAHEYQHLINAGRRAYVNNAVADDEEVWLNEGLSHIAEELVFYRASGTAPRQNIGGTSFGA
ncbi:MAG: Ig-like domain-containing protein, partial [Gemmatimonadota bacterium]|nr:Ig-like domain-containing protein [Gemmatimonadota bacterium]